MTARTALLLLLATPLTCFAQGTPSDTREPVDGFWPTERITSLMIERWLDEVSYKYDMEDEQVSKARERALKRWPKFLEENRSKIQPVVNEFIEMRLEMEPPSKERVKEWATRAQDALGLFQNEANEAIDEFRGVLNPLQKAKFETEVMEFSAGMAAAKAKLDQWQTGEYEEREFWDPPPSEWRKRREARMREESGEAAPEPLDQVEQELLAWDRYTEQFIELYKLDESQQATARSVLKEMKERALRYRDSNRNRIALIEKRIAEHSGSEEELAELKKDLIAVYGPVDEMFQELKDRLEGLPTAEQKAALSAGSSDNP